MTNTVIALIVIVVLLIAYMTSQRMEMYTGPAGPIIEAIQKNERQRGSFIDFRNKIGDKNFSPLMYAKLVELERTGKMTPAAVDKILAEK
jgi:hypothetical protein